MQMVFLLLNTLIQTKGIPRSEKDNVVVFYTKKRLHLFRF
ncbi:MAG: hypothetical protein UW27_C0005G0027 [Parcubacteria group bacterium GW2011_GWA1_44_13]|uniref:Uncharacterized protein n=1 Tax=Candidatus Nomurabacteria bacterium GW2011_GWB1_44_12 TaxID=1618748 RepID=A0A837I7F4_9BACT|nr:MAG: hypothetical protein UW17_C0011G0005 [Candidatus Nomurabacteria bacterium GW2011_GWD1_44_10]KKT36709.1 MAG: hypothetical protein UW25_C0004G0037 [Candidatus Nomurabacteria bacterium GW2011_GWB1_44_12]KKT38084.1 MAG: hypothetical protein UW27_C0005G0027 [Parcubacteria group bacterium GW2011_GWA1_44_13]KKT59768.1 MAG: hypothetical protein UW54_C0020G0010 [Parcubacteria group bacterium GW2011_GWC1_44_26]